MDMLTNLTIPELLALQWANNLARYFLFAGLSYLIFWKWGFSRMKEKFLYKERPDSRHMRREVLFSLMSTLIFILPTLVVVSIGNMGWSKIYYSIDERGMLWYCFSYVMVFFLHDAYFYWTHRLMHTRKLYSTFHKTHHLSIQPSPLAAFSFHPLEALVESFIFILIPFFLPVHFSVILLFTLFSLFMNVYGHLGFGLIKNEKLDRFPMKLFSHSTHHSWHHRYVRGNYGFYLRFWDKAMGTWKGPLKLD